MVAVVVVVIVIVLKSRNWHPQNRSEIVVLGSRLFSIGGSKRSDGFVFKLALDL